MWPDEHAELGEHRVAALAQGGDQRRTNAISCFGFAIVREEPT